MLNGDSSLDFLKRRAGLSGHLAFWSLLWLGLIWQLRMEWTINPQYTYGWGVPFLALYLGWKRWQTRPSARPPEVGAGWAASLLGCLLLLAPARLIQEANPDWRLVSWSYAILIVALSCCGLYYHGGRPWLRHFSFPIWFILIAVPWPTPIETEFIQGLMRGVAAMTVEIVNWTGLPAVQRGNLIELPNGLIGVNEACSGVRSFQATVMAALFLGELYRFRLWPRIALLGGGVLLALGLNVGRTFFLTWISARRGPEEIHYLHDPAGYAVMGLAFGLLWALAARYKPSGDGSEIPGRKTASFSPRRLPRWALAGCFLWFGFIGAANEWWYRAHERAYAAKSRWGLDWPEESRNFRFQEIPEQIRLVLRYTEGRSGVYRSPSGSEWLVYFFIWKPGRASPLLARSHSPEVCLPSTGIQMAGAIKEATVKAGPYEIPFRTYVFKHQGRPLHVFFCLWEDYAEPGDVRRLQDFSRKARLEAVLKGRRHLGQRVLEIVIAGHETREEALAELRELLPQWIRGPSG